MNAAARAHPEPPQPGARFAPGTGSGLSAALTPALERARSWAGDALRALVLSGSHARGEAVWAGVGDARVSLSDLDLYAIMADEAACAAARERAFADPFRPFEGTGALAAPLEVAFVTLEGLARMPARPGTIDLARSGRVIAGDAAVLAHLPDWRPVAVSAEERRLLLENRAFELLAGHTPTPGPLVAIRARHAVLKAALDAAVVRTLAHGELPASAAARVARARELPPPGGLPSWLEGAWAGAEPLWREALAWRAGAEPAAATDPVGEWRSAVRVWSAAWWADSDGPHAAQGPWERALQAAARGSWLRRLRRAWTFRARTGATPRRFERLRLAAAGTPALRIHGSAVVLLLAAAQSPHEPRLPAGALRALHVLGVTRAPSFDGAAHDTLVAWDRQLHDGQRSVETA